MFNVTNNLTGRPAKATQLDRPAYHSYGVGRQVEMAKAGDFEVAASWSPAALHYRPIHFLANYSPAADDEEAKAVMDTAAEQLSDADRAYVADQRSKAAARLAARLMPSAATPVNPLAHEQAK